MKSTPEEFSREMTSDRRARNQRIANGPLVLTVIHLPAWQAITSFQRRVLDVVWFKTEPVLAIQTTAFIKDRSLSLQRPRFSCGRKHWIFAHSESFNS